MAEGSRPSSGHQARPGVCPICHHDSWELLFDGLADRLFGLPGEFSVFICQSCSAWRLWPLPDDLADYYPDDYPMHVATVNPGKDRPWHHSLWRQSFAHNAAVRRFARSRLRRNEAASEMWGYLLSTPGSVLDYGCGSGRFLRFALQLGMTVFGVDPSDNAVSTACGSGVRAVTGTYEGLPEDIGSFDLVRLNHVLEHVEDPVDALRTLRRHVSPSGRLAVTVPNTDSAVADLFGQDWYNLDAPRHLWDFNPHNLGMAFEHAGFEVERVQFNGDGVNVYQSIRYALESKGLSRARRQVAGSCRRMELPGRRRLDDHNWDGEERMKLLVCGGAGFIGSAFVRRMLERHADWEIVCLDKLTYAGNLDNLLPVAENPRYSFVRADIGDRVAVDAAIDAAGGVDAIVNFAAETHVDRSIDDPESFLRTDIFSNR